MFTEVTNTAGVAYTGTSFGASWGDFNEDGFVDLWVTNHNRPGQLFLNQQNGTFVDISATAFTTVARTDKHGAAWADFDNDGDLDLMQTVGSRKETGSGLPNILFVNTDGLLIDQAEERGLTYPLGRGRTPVWFDYNDDGLLDLWVGNLVRDDRQAPPTFFKQTSDNKFISVRQETGVTVEQSNFAILADVTGDGRLDLINRGFDPLNKFKRVTIYDMSTLPFTNVTNNLLPNGLNAIDFVAADFNNDRRMDLYLADDSKDVLLMNSDQKLVDNTASSGISNALGESRGVVTGDFDNDMDVDIYVIKGSSSANTPDILYENQGNGTFVIVPNAGGAAGTSEGRADTVTVADYDRDGFLDLFTTNGADNGPYGPSQLFRNQGNGNNWIEINLDGTVSNVEGIGTQVFVTAGGVTQLREQSGGVHKHSQDSSVLHFGLGNNTIIDQIRIKWASGIEQVLANIPVNQLIQIQEFGSVPPPPPNNTGINPNPPGEVIPQDVTTGTRSADILVGTADQDVLTGNERGDRFVFSGVNKRTALRSSTLENLDRITDFRQVEGDRIQLDFNNNLNTVELPKQLFNAKRFKGKLEDVVKQAYVDKNFRQKGNQGLKANEAVFFKISKRTYLSVNNNRRGFSANTDLLINVSGINFKPGDLDRGTLPIANYFM